MADRLMGDISSPTACLLYGDILVLDKCGSPGTQIQGAADNRGSVF